MRLEKIRLSGFKSFVDPTTVALPGNLIGIVGPNGCGKSNIIDAIRWVMGESSAKHLRGGSMTDVIFNGSGGRKPVAMAFVELVFDNTDSTVGGEYASYSTLAIKRQLSRDGQSLYFLNGSRCRRKDIVDIFLGTGLGPRSYAVIEQGTISRLIEAKPDEMRVFIEEAAGISKYKERRHETEIRMRHTRENLERLIDLRDEVEKQVGHLRRQADKASQFKALREEERLFHKQLLAMRWREYDAEVRNYDNSISTAAETVNQRMREMHELDKDIETARNEYKQTQLSLNELQASYYQASSRVSQTQQAISHAQTASDNMHHELQLLQQSKQQSSLETQTDESQLQQICDDRAKFQSELEETLGLSEELADLHEQAQQAQQQWNAEWESVRQQLSEKQSQHAICLHTAEQAEASHQQLSMRHERLTLEHSQASESELSEQIATLDEECLQLEEQQQQLQQQLLTLTDSIQSQRQKLSEAQTTLTQYQQELHKTQGQISSLETLQKNATGEDNQSIQSWLNQHELSDAPRLASQIDVENGWESAIEIVLDKRLEAVCILDCEAFKNKFSEQASSSLMLIESRAQNGIVESDAEHGLLPLSRKLKSEWALDGILSQVYCVDDLEQAYTILPKFRPEQSLITKDGLWVGPGWIIKPGSGVKSSGVLKREKQLKQLRTNLVELNNSILSTEETIDETQQRLTSIELNVNTIRSEDKQFTALLLEKTTQLAGHQAHQEQIKQRLKKLESELVDIDGELHALVESKREYQVKNELLIQELETIQTRYLALEATKDEIASRAYETSHSYQTAQETVRQLESQLQMLDSTEQIANSQMQRSQRLQEEAVIRISKLQQSLKDSVEPLKDLTQQLLENQQQSESSQQSLNELRDELEIIEQKVVELTTQRSDFEHKASNAREQLEQARINQQACHVRRQTVIEQLAELEESAEIILQALEEDATIKNWEASAAQVKVRIDRLGTVNLAAIEEVEAQSERLDFLNQQYDDLQESLDSLEQAISKIDNESKARFRETFDNINQGLQDKFPRLFGGGRAKLDLSDNDLLTAGVKIMAQPPGKRNASIHLLSGGEKALTAVALVFSIFELNPAPFCLLDEVDAPLDDANVGRFGAMLQEMSKSVQFIAISHNKATMEICKQMIGVTMKEAGVSRVVAVDIDEAVEMAVN